MVLLLPRWDPWLFIINLNATRPASAWPNAAPERRDVGGFGEAGPALLPLLPTKHTQNLPVSKLMGANPKGVG